jgi:hypothetical protein
MSTGLRRITGQYPYLLMRFYKKWLEFLNGSMVYQKRGHGGLTGGGSGVHVIPKEVKKHQNGW